MPSSRLARIGGMRLREELARDLARACDPGRLREPVDPGPRGRRDPTRRSDGIFGVVELQRPAVFVVALTDEDEVVLVTVDRHTVGPSVEVPAGGTDGEDPLVAARRELAEETGLVAGDVAAGRGHERPQRRLPRARGGLPRRPGSSRLAGAADDAAARPRRASATSAACRSPTCSRSSRDGTITDGETIAALMFALVALGRVA